MVGVQVCIKLHDLQYLVCWGSASPIHLCWLKWDTHTCSCISLQTVVPGNPVDDFKLLVRTVGSLVRANALRNATKDASKELVA